MKKPPAEFRVLRLRECMAPATPANTPAEAAAYWLANIPRAPWFDPDKECAVILALNTRRNIIGHNLVAVGCLDSVTVHPREVFRPLIVAGAHAGILIHNHPSGDPAPGQNDIKITRELVRAGQLLRIEMLDHLVIGGVGPKWASLRELGYIYE